MCPEKTEPLVGSERLMGHSVRGHPHDIRGSALFFLGNLAKEKMMQTVICDHAWPYARGAALVKGEKYLVVKSFWYNGEGWFTVKRLSNGAVTTAPDVFFGDL